MERTKIVIIGIVILLVVALMVWGIPYQKLKAPEYQGPAAETPESNAESIEKALRLFDAPRKTETFAPPVPAPTVKKFSAPKVVPTPKPEAAPEAAIPEDILKKFSAPGN